ncbi:hypothetical protein N7492_008900 [Penicillium capsulatum]|uniref:Nicotinamide N-methyltransferase n=1 Tax=Penicillium capsulatum TaxID=69766 RepID=A0A9W9HSV7_9EURO|nr:hypothetical protein N7492_008900 [Penicillium capsulatum]KAJ6106300.1 hypothetical protein N7512_009817 [Penicillium capsulatum]
MLRSRLRPLPRHPTSAAPVPDYQDGDEQPVEESPEDFFEGFLAHLFPDDAPPFHGDPGQHLLYSSPRYGNLEIMVPSYPGQSSERTKEIGAGRDTINGTANPVEEGRKLFAHFLWSAALVVAEGVEAADSPEDAAGDPQSRARDIWKVKGESVLELGAGAALPSLVCALANASTVVATDHPSSPALTGAIDFNMNHNLHNRSPTTAKVSIQPHTWGELNDSFARENKGAFTRIIAADCLWMRSQHDNLVQTLQWFLAPGGKVWVVAGFHTARPIVASFFETAQNNGFEMEHIFERDLNVRSKDGGEVHREWATFREDEGLENVRRWVVIAVLVRK